MSLFAKGEYLDNKKYQIINTLGAGGFGITYLARECKSNGSKTNKKVVIKFLNVQKIVNDGKGKTFGKRQQDFINEALTLASFEHPYIVKSEAKIIQVLLDDELRKATDEKWLQGMVMEYIEGENLIWHLQRNGIFSEKKALKIIEQIGSALDYIHNKGLLHRDVKPQNIMLRESNGDAVLIDFGLARKFSMAESMTMTSAMTPAFAPPEQFENKTRFTPALDIYSLAATLYVLVAVKDSPYTPLPSPYLTSVIMMQTKMPLRSPQELNSSLSDKITRAILWGMEFEATKRPQNIGEWLESLILKESSKDANIYFQRGLKHQNNKEYEKAIADYNQAIKLDSNYTDAYFYRGNFYDKLGQYEKAIADYNQAIQLDSKNARYYNNRGISYHKLGQYEKAIADYNQAIQLDPNYTDAYFYRGNSYDELGQYEKAIADYNRVIKLDPNCTYAYYSRDNSYDELRQYEKAIEDYTQAIKLAKNIRYYNNRVIKLFPKDAVYYYNRGNSYSKLGQNEKAIEDYNQAIKLDPKNARYYNNRGISYYKWCQYEKAIEDYNQAIKLDPNYAFAYNNRGNSYKKLGQNEKAIADFTQAIKLDPNNKTAQKNRHNLLKKLGKK